MEKLKPLHDRVVIKPHERETVTSGGIIIPDTAKEKPLRGKVIAVGQGKKDEPMTVRIGDNVIFSKYGGTEVQIDGNEYMILKESEILAII
jgi:chaperonin GroES